MKVTFFIPPNGHREVREITNVRPEDEKYFTEHNIKISMEELSTGQHAVYADTGMLIDGEPTELLEISYGRSCKDTLAALRVRCEQQKEDGVI